MQQKGSGGQKPGQQRNQKPGQGSQQQVEVDKKRERWRKIGQQQEENYKKWRKAGVAIGDDQSSGR
jgi:hypothetical protein